MKTGSENVQFVSPRGDLFFVPTQSAVHCSLLFLNLFRERGRERRQDWDRSGSAPSWTNILVVRLLTNQVSAWVQFFPPVLSHMEQGLLATFSQTCYSSAEKAESQLHVSEHLSVLRWITEIKKCIYFFVCAQRISSRQQPVSDHHLPAVVRLHPMEEAA